jgi:uncharacterized protein (TIGR00255 family)
MFTAVILCTELETEMMVLLKSMTGFGRAEKMTGGHDITVEIKSVNHRFFDLSSHITRGYGFLEDKVKTFLQRYIARGKLDVSVSLEPVKDSGVTVAVNHPLAAGYVAALRELTEKYGLSGGISAADVARYPEVFTVGRAPENEGEVCDSVLAVTAEALDSVLKMRETEGMRLKDDLSRRAQKIVSIVSEIEKRSPETVAEYREKLKARLKDMLGDIEVDEQRVLTEAAVFADKVSVTEETVRLRSHVSQFNDMLESDKPIGRKLDFIVQEMNREANTIGSKCVDARISHDVVDMKAEIEKIREQIQNIE